MLPKSSTFQTTREDANFSIPLIQYGSVARSPYETGMAFVFRVVAVRVAAIFEVDGVAEGLAVGCGFQRRGADGFRGVGDYHETARRILVHFNWDSGAI